MEEKKTHKWTDEDTEKLIKVRMDLDSDFTGKRNSAEFAWINVLHRIGLNGKVTPTQIAKKWDNLKRKYKELRCPPKGTSTGVATAITWQWFSLMHEAIGGSLPPILKDACAEVAINTKDTGLPPPKSVEEEECQAGTSNSQEEEPSTSVGPPARKRRRTNKILDFLEKEAKKEEERFQATHQLMQRTTDRFLNLFEQFIKKM